VLVVMTGLPATGKSSIATALAERLDGEVLSEDALASNVSARRRGKRDRDLEHFALLAHAEILLGCGHTTVVVDAVNGTNDIRGSWWLLADRWATPCAFVHTVCSDEKLRRRRLEGRTRAARKVAFEPLAREDLVLDSVRALDENVDRAWRHLQRSRPDGP
jgi:predicted kinase